jgi:osmotically inducible protein OsmC
MTARTSTTNWTGDLATGSGVVHLDSSDAAQFPVTFPTRAGEPDGHTSPEELIAAAHSACFSMSLAHGLTTAGAPPTALAVSATVEVDRLEGALTIHTIRLDVEGEVPGLTAEQFDEAVQTAKAGCPVSRALAGVSTIEATARLRS